MPQMAPMSWLTLFIFFTMIFFMFNMINYFSFLYNKPQTIINKKSIKTLLNWKW
uniref:ATP synthase complex subunit 8 n=1 Tax=Metopsia clypeata TaxID=346803 RepID=A0A0S2M7P8_9COLE|nr:ATP synthase F0 subunit 8 [Metopsia clypeata]